MANNIKSSGIPDGPLPPGLLALDLHWTQRPECYGCLKHEVLEQDCIRLKFYKFICCACGEVVEMSVKY